MTEPETGKSTPRQNRETSSSDRPDRPWSQSADEVLKSLDVEPHEGLSEEQVQKEQQQKAQQQMQMAKKQNEMEIEKEVSIAEGKERAESISNQTRNIDPTDIAQIKKIAQEEGVPDEVVASSVLQKEQESSRLSLLLNQFLFPS